MYITDTFACSQIPDKDIAVPSTRHEYFRLIFEEFDGEYSIWMARLITNKLVILMYYLLFSLPDDSNGIFFFVVIDS